MFYHGPVRVGFVVDKVALVRILLPVLRFSPVSVIPSITLLIYVPSTLFSGLFWPPKEARKGQKM